MLLRLGSEEWVSKIEGQLLPYTLYKTRPTVGLHTYCILFWLKYSSLHFLIPLHLNIRTQPDWWTPYVIFFEGRSKIVTCTDPLGDYRLPPPSYKMCIVFRALWCAGDWNSLSSRLESGTLMIETLFYELPLFPVPSRLPGSECGFQYCLLKYVLNTRDHVKHQLDDIITSIDHGVQRGHFKLAYGWRRL